MRKATKPGKAGAVRKTLPVTAAEQSGGLTRFADNLKKARMDRGMSQSDLAREIWGTMPDPRGYEVARNRDRISVYERGLQVPEADTLKMLSDFLGIPVTVLAPDLTAETAGNNKQPANGIRMTTIEGSPGDVLLQINTFTSMATAMKIIDLMAKDQTTRRVQERGRG